MAMSHPRTWPPGPGRPHCHQLCASAITITITIDVDIQPHIHTPVSISTGGSVAKRVHAAAHDIKVAWAADGTARQEP
jgi:hypothetical protein